MTSRLKTAGDRPQLASPEPHSPPRTTKMFGTPADLWTTYRAGLFFRDKLMN
jgi:hypothetical protein